MRCLILVSRRPGWLLLLCAICWATLAQPHAVQAQTAINPPAPGQPPSPSEQARALFEARKYLEVERFLQKSLEDLAKKPVDEATALEMSKCRNWLISAHSNTDRFKQARIQAAQSAPIVQQLIQQYPNNPDFRLEQARIYSCLGQSFHRAEQYLEAATYFQGSVTLLRKLCQDHPDRGDFRKDLCGVMLDTAGYQMHLARYPEAESLYQEAIQQARHLVKETPNNPDYQIRLALALNAYALLVREAGHFHQAAELIREAITVGKQLEKDHPTQPKYWRQLPTMYRNLAMPLSYLGNKAEEKASNQEGLRYEMKLLRMQDKNAPVLTDEDRILGILQSLDVDRLLQQEAEIEALHEKFLKRDKDFPQCPSVQQCIAMAKVVKGLRLLVGSAPRDQFEPLFQDAVAIYQRLTTETPDVPKFKRWQAEFYNFQGMALLGTLNFDEADKLFKKSFALMEAQIQEHPKVPRFRSHLAQAQARLVMIYQPMKEPEKALFWYKESLGQTAKLAEAFPTFPEYRRHHAMGYVTLGNMLMVGKKAEAAEAAFREGVNLWEKMVTEFPKELEWRRSLGHAWVQYVSFLVMQERYAEAEKVFPAVIRKHEELVAAQPKLAEYHSSLGGVWSWVSMMHEKQRQQPQAIAAFSKSLSCLETACTLNPRQRGWLETKRAMLIKRAEMYSLTNQTKEHAADLQQAKALELMLEDPLLRMIRLRHQLGDGQVGPTLTEAEDLYHNVDLLADQWHELAEIYAGCAQGPLNPQQKDGCAARAVSCLQRAQENGYTSLVPVRDNPNFQGLIQRADFQQLTK